MFHVKQKGNPVPLHLHPLPDSESPDNPAVLAQDRARTIRFVRQHISNIAGHLARQMCIGARDAADLVSEAALDYVTDHTATLDDARGRAVAIGDEMVARVLAQLEQKEQRP